MRKKNLRALLGRDQASLSCKPPPSPSQTLEGFPQVLKALLKPLGLVTRHTAGGSPRAFPAPSTWISLAWTRTPQQQSSSCTAPAHTQQSHRLQQHGMGHWRATIPSSHSQLQADHPAPRYPHDRLRATPWQGRHIINTLLKIHLGCQMGSWVPWNLLHSYLKEGLKGYYT